MAQKKPAGKSPIRITLTEDQISDIIQRAAKTRRNLSARSLEDRIAPSLVGGPMMDPSLVEDPSLTGDAPLMGGGPAGGMNPDFDGDMYPSDPHLIDPNLPEGPYDPTMPPVSDTQLEAPVPPGGDLPGGAPYDPNMPPVSDGMLPPPNPDGIPGVELGGSNLPGGYASGPGGHVPGSGMGHVPGSGMGHTPGQMEMLHGGHNPADGLPSVPTGDTIDPDTGDAVDTTDQNSGSTATTPSSQELQEHRRNILRQLRGN